MNCPTCGHKIVEARSGHQGGKSKPGWYYKKRRRERLGLMDVLPRGRPKLSEAEKVAKIKVKPPKPIYEVSLERLTKKSFIKFARSKGWEVE